MKFEWTDSFGDHCDVQHYPGEVPDVLEFTMHEDHRSASGTMDDDTARDFHDWLGRMLYGESQEDRP